MTYPWETTVSYRRVLIAGGIWNLAAGIPTMIMIPYLPELLHIEEPRYPIFIYFNLMTVTLFGFIHFVVSRNLREMRGMMTILMWSKLFTAGIFGVIVFRGPIPPALVEFLAPAMVIDLVFGLVYLRYLLFSRHPTQG